MINRWSRIKTLDLQFARKVSYKSSFGMMLETFYFKDECCAHEHIIYWNSRQPEKNYRIEND